MRTLLALFICICTLSVVAQMIGPGAVSRSVVPIGVAVKKAGETAGGGGGGSGNPNIENTQTTNSTAANLDHVIGIDVGASGQNRLLTVSICWCASGGTPMNVTVHPGATPVPIAAQFRLEDYGCTNALFRLIAPATGILTISNRAGATLSEFAMVAHSWTNVNQTTPLGLEATNSTDGATIGMTNTIACADRDTGFDQVCYYTDIPTYTPGTGQTQRGVSHGPPTMSTRTSTCPITTTTTNMSWVFSSAIEHNLVSIAVKAVP
jgi:hypothetical protein